jgi:hypothetical protein
MAVMEAKSFMTLLKVVNGMEDNNAYSIVKLLVKPTSHPLTGRVNAVVRLNIG